MKLILKIPWFIFLFVYWLCITFTLGIVLEGIVTSSKTSGIGMTSMIRTIGILIFTIPIQYYLEFIKRKTKLPTPVIVTITFLICYLLT